MTKQDRTSHKRQFLKSTIIGFGFLSGLWLHLGFDPGTFVYNFLQKLLIAAEPQYTQTIKVVFLTLPIILTCIGWLGAYRRAGLWGVFAVLLALGAGMLFNPISILLLGGAIVIGFFAAKR
jgi:hypothetical protein